MVSGLRLVYDLEPRMPMKDEQAQAKASSKTAVKSEPARRYLPPRVEPLGDVRDLTFGGSPGVGDSGPPNTKVIGT